MLRTRYITLLALVAGLVATGCGSEPNPASSTKAPTIAAAADKMAVATPTPIVEPGECLNLANSTTQGRCFDRVEGCNKLTGNDKTDCLQHIKVCLSTTMRKRRCFGQPMTTTLKVKPMPKPKPQTIKDCLNGNSLTSYVDANVPSVITISDEYDEMVSQLNRYDTSVEARRNKRDLDKWDDEGKGETEAEGWEVDESNPWTKAEVIGNYLVQYLDPNNNDHMDAIHDCVAAYVRSN